MYIEITTSDLSSFIRHAELRDWAAGCPDAPKWVPYPAL